MMTDFECSVKKIFKLYSLKVCNFYDFFTKAYLKLRLKYKKKKFIVKYY